ncbi:hypothetical protein CNMCM8927_004149 [Aspergillus lentulus]|nr:hypothetical protein CNMCM8060_003719 [Aspergillus lentulus]KAF4176685.1 hypothetical protein CNMCM7927_003899 [Aspergillus lentulus]KAF4190549.1 hypothetical protein CNMCM8694_003569 [Aspergillus lentulus]KAF4200022.1 hypothetical protein CNMCM8927_004149 [Aspergillus lentulus]
MDADAKGQVGGLDVDVGVRRQYAAESRRWVCDVCEGGRSNEEVLMEWREVCRAKGVEVEEDEVQGTTPEKTEAGPEREPEDTNAKTNTIASAETTTSHQESESMPSRDAAPQRVEAQVPVPSAPAEVAAPAPAPAPTRTTPVQTTTTTTTTSRPTISDAPWLDRAILGVLVALAFMIVRRLAKSEEF